MTIRQRMCILAEGAAVDVVEEGSPAVVAASLASALSPVGPWEALWSLSSRFSGADELASCCACWLCSAMFISETGPELLALEPCTTGAPVLGRLWVLWSLSSGERDLLRVDSRSGMVVIQFLVSFRLQLGIGMCLGDMAGTECEGMRGEEGTTAARNLPERKRQSAIRLQHTLNLCPGSPPFSHAHHLTTLNVFLRDIIIIYVLQCTRKTLGLWRKASRIVQQNIYKCYYCPISWFLAVPEGCYKQCKPSKYRYNSQNRRIH